HRRWSTTAGRRGSAVARTTDGGPGQSGPGADQKRLPAELTRLHTLLERGLTATADLWPSLRVAFGWVHRAAHLLGLKDASGSAVRSYMAGLLGAMARHRQRASPLADGVDHFLKVTRSYWPGLFHCYDVDDLPRTNNALEQQFGSHRYHERR